MRSEPQQSKRQWLSKAQAAREAGCKDSASVVGNWLRRDNTHFPSVRAAGAKLWVWHQTAQHEPTPEQPEPFDEEGDARRAAAVEATVHRLGLSNAQAATEAGNVCQNAAGCWFRRVNTHMPSVRAAAAKLWAWHQTAQHRPPVTAECPKCGKTAADFPRCKCGKTASGLRSHTRRCSGPDVQTGADEATDAQQATALLGTIQTPGQTPSRLPQELQQTIQVPHLDCNAPDQTCRRLQVSWLQMHWVRLHQTCKPVSVGTLFTSASLQVCSRQLLPV